MKADLVMLGGEVVVAIVLDRTGDILFCPRGSVRHVLEMAAFGWTYLCDCASINWR